MDNEKVIENIIGSVSKAGYENMIRNDSDYIDGQGLLVCGVCGERKETIITIGGKIKKVPCVCACTIAERERIEERLRKSDTEREIRKLRDASLMDDNFKSADFSKLISNNYNSKNIQLGRRYVDRFDKFFADNQGLLFWGDVGTGKSVLAACIANQLIEHGVPVIMTSFVKLMELFRRSDEEEKNVINRINNAKLAIFDDFGAERKTDYALEKIYDVIDSRYRSGKPMIVTTNLILQDMINETDDRYRRIYDRIFEVCYPMKFEGPSWRRKTANARFKEMEKLIKEG